MTVYIDPPTWPGHGRLWSHLISDESFEELHSFADVMGTPPQAFDGDHYDIPAEHYGVAVGLGAVEIDTKALVHRLHAAGLRRRKPARF
jgi:hypothetical protein